ncbi:MAG: hypothetical protein AB7E80_02180 [Hyphomicrobiaceae bacterium]
MRVAEFQIVPPATAELALPCRIEQRTSRRTALLALTALLPLVLLLILATLPLVEIVASAPSPLALLAAHPAAVSQIAIVLGLSAALLGVATLRAVDRLARTRTVLLHPRVVTVTDKGPMGETSFTLPLASFRGVAHNIRTGILGQRHELILVNADRRRSVLLMAADRLGKADIEKAAATLGLPEIPASALYVANRNAATVQRLPTTVIGTPSQGSETTDAACAAARIAA